MRFGEYGGFVRCFVGLRVSVDKLAHIFAQVSLRGCRVRLLSASFAVAVNSRVISLFCGGILEAAVILCR